MPNSSCVCVLIAALPFVLYASVLGEEDETFAPHCSGQVLLQTLRDQSRVVLTDTTQVAGSTKRAIGSLEPRDSILDAIVSAAATKSRSKSHKAVIANHNGLEDVSWMTAVAAVDEVGLNSTKAIGEFGPWLKWIVDHYDGLPDYTIFLHGANLSWHASLNASDLIGWRPQSIQMLSSCGWANDDFYGRADQSWGLDILYPALFGKGFKKAWSQWSMVNNYTCCGESIVASRAVRKIDKVVYQGLLNLTNTYPFEPWGWIWERTWQNLFSKPTRPTKEVLANLAWFAEQRRPPPAYAPGGTIDTYSKIEPKCDPLPGMRAPLG